MQRERGRVAVAEQFRRQAPARRRGPSRLRRRGPARAAACRCGDGSGSRAGAARRPSPAVAPARCAGRPARRPCGRHRRRQFARSSRFSVHAGLVVERCRGGSPSSIRATGARVLNSPTRAAAARELRIELGDLRGQLRLLAPRAFQPRLHRARCSSRGSSSWRCARPSCVADSICRLAGASSPTDSRMAAWRSSSAIASR